MATNFELDFNKRFKLLDARLVKVQNNIQVLMYRSLSEARVSSLYWNMVRRDLDVLYKEINSIFAAVVGPNEIERLVLYSTLHSKSSSYAV